MAGGENNFEQLVEAIHRSGQTALKPFQKIHNFYRAKSKLYYRWHLNPYSSTVHKIILAAFIVVAIFVSYYIVNPFSTLRIRAAGATIYVDAASSCVSSCGSSASPYKTIQNGVNAANAGDVIVVRAGTYNERVNLTKTGTAVNPIILQANSTDRPVVTNGFNVTGAYITVKQFDVTVGTTDRGQAAYLSGNHNTVDDVFANALKQHDVSICNCVDDPNNPTFQFLIAGSYNTVQNSRSINSWGTGLAFEGDHGRATNCEVQHGWDSFWDNKQWVETGGQYNGVYNSNLHGPNRQGGIVDWTGWDPSSPSAGSHDFTISGNKLYDLFRPPNTVEHSETIGGYVGWANVTVENNVIGSRRYGTTSSPITINGLQWNSADGIQGLLWFGNSPGPHETYQNITWRNNVCLEGESSSWFQKQGGANVNGLYFYNNLFYTNNGTIWDESEGGTDTNIYSRNNAFVMGSITGGGISGTYVSDHNWSWNGSSPALNTLFVNPDVSAATYYGVNADWHLLSTASVLKGAGIGPSSDANVPTADKDGVARSGATTDLGPYLYRNQYYVSTTGNDSSGGSQASPWRTIQKAANTVVAGDTVNIGPGTYDERVTVSRSGTSVAGIKFIAQSTRPQISKGVLIQGSYIEFSDFKPWPMYAGIGSETGAVQVMGSNNYVHDFDIPTGSTAGSAIVINEQGAASYNAVANFQVTDTPGVCGAYGPQTSHNVIKDGYCHGFGDGTAIGNLDGSYNTLDNVEITSVGTSHVGGGWNAGTGSDGDAVHPLGTNNTIKNCKLHHIFAYWSYASGAHTDTIQFWNSTGTMDNLTIENNILGSNSTAPSGGQSGSYDPPNGVIMAENQSAATVHVTFRNNVVLGDAGVGPGYWLQFNNGGPGNVSINAYNNTFFTTHNMMTDAKLVGTFKNNIINFDGNNQPGGLSFVNNLYTAANLTHGESNFRVGDPKFVNPIVTAATNYGIDADWHLGAGSAAIGVGTGPSADINVPTTDKDGVARSGATTDIGAYMYESGSSCNRVPDINGDGHVNILDAAVLMANWGSSPTNPLADINCDSQVNILDAAVLMAHWG